MSRTKIRAQAVTGPKLADGAVTDRKLPDAAVTNPKLADGAVTATKLAPLTQVELTGDPVVPTATTGTVTAMCPDGTTVISGGGFPSTFEMSLTTSIRMGNGWRVQSTNHTGVGSDGHRARLLPRRRAAP